MNLMPETLYCLGLLNEECSEVGQIVGKALRFGIDTPSYEGEPYLGRTARELLELELGDVWAAMLFAEKHGVVNQNNILGHAIAKLRKLMDPEAKDNLGRRLAPPPKGHP